jgi:hypothetical protein
MTKQEILEEIRRTAKANGGKALGRLRFASETGIGCHDWQRHWLRWNDAVREAGLQANRKSEAYSNDFLLQKLVQLTRLLQRVPVRDGDLRLASNNDSTFPSHSVFRRLGSKAQLVSRVIAYCESHSGYEDVSAVWRAVAITEQPQAIDEAGSVITTVGYVYLLKHGSRREYKIGRTNNPIRREGELGIQFPEKSQPVHYIKTDDPAGVETYWHTRFASKRKEGEWFALTPDDVRAFKRWKRVS